MKDKAMNTLGKVAIGAVVTLVILYFIGVSDTGSNTSQLTDQAKDNTLRNKAKVEFVEGCMETNSQANKAYCECAFEAIGTVNGFDWYTNEQLVRRMLSDGYNYTELEAVSNKCDSQYVGATNES